MEQRPVSWKSIAVAVVLLAGLLLGLLWLWRYDFNVRQALAAGVNLLREAGPLAFFTAMALLPAAGMPISIFSLTAGTAFAGQLGMPGVLLAAGFALAVNLSLTYWLARYGLRPWLEQMIGRTKYKIPAVATDEQAEITVLLRITPGPPFFVQSYLLGLAGVRFGTYLWISWAVSMAYTACFILFGDAILHGKARLAIVALSVLVAVALFVHLLRRHYGKKRT